jgi:hypothetical protein
MKEYEDWLSEVWEIKREIAAETETMSFGDYVKYLNGLAQRAEKRMKVTEKTEKVSDKKRKIKGKC